MGAIFYIMLLIPNANWLFPAFILMNLTLVGLRISRLGITMEFGSLDKLPTFVALAYTLLAVPMLFPPTLIHFSSLHNGRLQS